MSNVKNLKKGAAGMKKKKKWRIPLCVIGGLLLICAGILWYMVSHSMGFSVGRCLVADNGSYLFIDGSSPIVMSTRREKEKVFAGLETGDKILILHNGIEESYPGGTGVYWCMKLENGAQADIPEQVVEELAELGWITVSAEDEAMSADSMEDNGELYEPTPAMAGLVGVSRTPATYAYQDPWGVKLTAKNITPSGLTIVCTQQDGEPTGELNTGSYYGLEVLRDNKWVTVEMLPLEGDLAWTAEAWVIPADTEIEWEVNWSRIYGEIPAGSYRISKSVMDFRDTGDYDEKTYYAGFDIVDAATANSVSYEYGGFGVSVPLLSGWEYKIEEYNTEGMSYGVSFRPSDEEGWIDFHYWPTFGVCGTGLETKEFGNGTMGTYDGGAIWNYISYPASQGNFVATTQNVNSWWPQYKDEAMAIITQVICTDTIMD